jgi:hypothetical protein
VPQGKVFGRGDDAASLQDARIFTGEAQRGGLCISPKLQEWVANELKIESAVLKERRKAHEERALAKPGK